MLRIACVLVPALLPVVAEARGVIVVPAGSPPEALATAVASAAPGDAILVQGGNYYGFVADGKPLAIVADAGATVLVQGSVGVRNLPASGDFLFAGIAVVGAWTNEDNPGPNHTTGTAIYAFDCAGSVRVQGASLTGGVGDADCMGSSSPGGRAAWLRNAPDVAFAACTLVGGSGGGNQWGCWNGVGGRGGAGLEGESSSVALYECSVTGGRGGHQGDQAGTGGVGLVTSGTRGVFLSNTPVRGGAGGNGTGCEDPYFCCAEGYAGNGGDGLRMFGSTHVQRLASSFTGAAGGYSSCGHGNGSGGAEIVDQSSGGLFEFAVPPRALTVARVAREGALITVSVAGQPGDVAVLALARETGFAPIPSWRGVLMPVMPAASRWRILGTIPASGVLDDVLAVADLGPGVLARTVHMQVLVVDAQGANVLGSHATVLALDGSL